MPSSFSVYVRCFFFFLLLGVVVDGGRLVFCCVEVVGLGLGLDLELGLEMRDLLDDLVEGLLEGLDLLALRVGAMFCCVEVLCGNLASLFSLGGNSKSSFPNSKKSVEMQLSIRSWIHWPHNVAVACLPTDVHGKNSPAR